MKQPANRNQNPTLSNTAKIVIATILLGLAALVFVALLALWFGGPLLQRLTQAGQAPQPAPGIPTLFVPTPDCGPPTLVLGSTTFQMQTLTPAPDGSFPAPPAAPGVAYWVEGTDTNYVFVLSPAPENLSLMSTITIGTNANATWSNCNSRTYSLFAPEPGSLNASTLPDQSVAGITVFFQSDASGNGFVVKGELTEEIISTINTPVSGGSEIQAEISLLETTPSSDGSTIRIGVSIQNYGQSAFTLSINDVLLTPQDAVPLTMVDSEPALPKEIGAGATETIYFTFPRPPSPTAILKILTIEYDIEGY